MTELTLEDLQEDTGIQAIPDGAIKLNMNFSKKINILAQNIKDFMLDTHKLLFVSGIKGKDFINCYFCNNFITVQWKESINCLLEEEVNFATDLRFLNKIIAYCKNDIILSDIYTNPSLWLYNNKIQLINTNLTKEQAKFEDIEPDKNMIKIPVLDEIQDIIKRYHLEKGSLSYDKDNKFYFKDFNLNTTGVFRSNTVLPLPCISLEILKLVNSFSVGMISSNSNFTIISGDDFILKAPNMSIEQYNAPKFVNSNAVFKIDIDVVKQLLKIIKLIHNNIQITLKVKERKFFIIGFIEGQKCIEYNIDIDTDKGIKDTEVSIVLDSLLDVIKEFSGIIEVKVDKNILEWSDNLYTLIIQQN